MNPKEERLVQICSGEGRQEDDRMRSCTKEEKEGEKVASSEIVIDELAHLTRGVLQPTYD